MHIKKWCEYIISTQIYRKMDEIIDNILKTNCLDYKEQCLYIANKLSSTDPIDTTHTVFLKKIYGILKRLPEILKELDDKTGTKTEVFFSFWYDFEGKTYFYDIRSYIRLNYTKLTHNDYIIKVPTKFASTVILHINTS